MIKLLCWFFTNVTIVMSPARGYAEIKCLKGIWWMPWRTQAMKDVVRCEKFRGVANKL